MSKLLRNILFSGALVVILLHAFIPHPHSDELTDKGHVKIHQGAKSIFGIISIAFHESDDESLDSLIVARYHLVKKTETKYPYLLIGILNNQLVIDSTAPEKTQKWSLDKISSLFIVELNGVRGPPFVS